ncbi:MAG: hypothetical protein JRI54_00250 [Deltaproteobacteria bacterium]|nr:hypothetical protein [Deltaproteobacteria bacterium]
MPTGYSSRCKVCNSQRRAEIEKWCKEEGLSPRAASVKLFEDHGEKISHQSIWKHMNEHFDIKAEVREQYWKSQEQMQQQVKKRLSDVEILDATITDNYELSRATQAWLKDLIKERRNPPLALVQLREKLQSEIRQAMRTRQELIGDDPQSRLVDAFQSLWDDDDDMDG